MDDERRHEHVGERLANIGREGQLEQVGRDPRTRGVALERGERGAFEGAYAWGEGVREHAAAEAPVPAHELDPATPR